jgi:transcriptional regulator with XRE-family HTH domain
MVGAAVRAARVQRGWSQASLGKRAGVPQSHIAKIEAGKDTRASTLLRVLDAMGYDLLFEPRDMPLSLCPRTVLCRAPKSGVSISRPCTGPRE